MKNNFIFIMYHHVRRNNEKFLPKLKSLKLSTFKRQLNYLQKKYRIVNYDDLIDIIIYKKNFKKPLCCLTFDDGYKNHYEYVFPELKKRNIQGFFFPPSKVVIENKLIDPNKIHILLASVKSVVELNKYFEHLFYEHKIEKIINLNFNELKVKYRKKFRFDNADTIFFKRIFQHVLPNKVKHKLLDIMFKKFVKFEEKEIAKKLYLNISQIKEMIDGGMYFGNHSYEHPWLEHCKKIFQTKEINKGLKFMSEIGMNSKKNWIMCYPYGSYNKSTLQIIKNKKCLIGLTTIRGEFKLQKHSNYEIPRVDCNDVFKY